jgi:hypothetical protein
MGRRAHVQGMQEVNVQRYPDVIFITARRAGHRAGLLDWS